MKYLILLLLLPTLLTAGTLYEPATTSATTIGTATEGKGGFGKMGFKVAVESTGTGWGFLMGHGSSNIKLLTYNGSTWTMNTAFFGFTGDDGSSYYGIQAYGDSMFAYGQEGVNANLTIKKIVGVTPATTGNDTVAAATSAVRAGLVLLNSGRSGKTGTDSIMMQFRWETTTTDTNWVVKNNGALASSNTYTKTDTNTTIFPEGPRIPYWYGNALLIFDEEGLDLFIEDSTGHRSTLTTALFDMGAPPNQWPGIASLDQLQYTMVTKADTLYLAWQDAEVCYVKRMRISGSPPTTLTLIDSTIILAAADMPTPVVATNPGYLTTFWEPQFTVVADTVYLFGHWWADQANLDSADICYWKGVGASWGEKTILLAAVNQRAWWRLQAPPFVPTNGGAYTIPIALCDSSSGSNQDSLYVYAETFGSGGGGTPTTNLVVRGGVIRTGVLRNRPEILWRD